jgi:hypothetical protein
VLPKLAVIRVLRGLKLATMLTQAAVKAFEKLTNASAPILQLQPDKQL